MTITDDRKKVLDFSEPYFDATQAMLVAKGSPIKGLDDLAGKTVGVQLGTTGADYVRANAPKSATIKEYEDLALLTAAVKSGQLDAGVNDNGVLFDYVKSNPDTQVATEFDTGEQYGFAVAKDQNDALLEDLDDVDRPVQEGRRLRRDLQEVLRRSAQQVTGRRLDAAAVTSWR